MAEFYTQFSCILDVGTADNATCAELVREEFAAEFYREEGGYPGFLMAVQPELGPGALWLYSDDQGDPEHVIQFVLRLAEELSLAGAWGFSWSHTCSKPRIDAFGGGAHVIDLGARRSIADIDCGNFVHEQIARRPAEAEAAGAQP
jgi:hypothetical protein